MRLLILAVFVIGCATATFVQPDYKTEFTADKDFLLKQKKVWQVLYRLWQPELKQDMWTEGQEYKIEANSEMYTDKEALKEFLHRYEHGFLPKHAVYSIMYEKAMEETKAIFKLLYSAKDFDTFFKTALYCRNRLNPGMFGYAYYLAVMHRPDTKYIRLPPLYEMAPHYFYNTELFEKAHHVKNFGKLEPKHSAGFDTYIIPYNYSSHYLVHEYDYEQRLNYFTEDVGLSSYYFFMRSEHPFFLSMKDLDHSDSHRGAEYLYAHLLLFNRYYLERLSNDLGMVEEYDYGQEFYPGYYPTMAYPNGLPFPVRPWESKFPKHKYHLIHEVEAYEARIGQAIDAGFAFTDKKEKENKWVNIYSPEGMNILGNMIEGNADSVHQQFYGSVELLTRNILGFNLNPTNPYKTQPSAMEHFSTSLRDPAFWRMYARIMDFYWKYKKNMKPYKPHEIKYPELKIESVDFDKLVTYFDYYDTTISHGLAVEDEKWSDTHLIQARQYRLNHKHFNVRMTVNAEKPMKAAVRIFLGPKMTVHNQEVPFSQYHNMFYEMDYFLYDMVAGANKIERNCHDFFMVDDEPEPSENFWKKLTKAIETGEELKMQKRILAFPQRLLLPKGKPEGMPYQFFVFVSPVNETAKFESRVFGDAMVDMRAWGYPLDRPISDYEFHGPNFFFKDVMIYHTQEHDKHISH